MRYSVLSSALVLLLGAGCGDDSSGTPDTGIMVDATLDAGPMIDCTGRPAEAPAPRGEVAGLFDAAKNRIVIFGGNTSAPVDCSPRYTQTAEMWAFELDCASWAPIAATGPSARSRHGVALDTTRNRMVIFGGMQGDPLGGGMRFNEVWAFDLATDTWQELVTSGTPPSRRGFPVVAYDAGRDRLLVHGGDPGGFNGTSDMFALDMTTLAWSSIDTAGGPPARLYHGGVIHGGRLVIFGGAGGYSETTYRNDIWAFDLATDTWTEVRGGGGDAPLTRFGAQIFSDAAGNRIIMFGGHDSTDLGNSNDVQAYSFGDDTWTLVRPGDTLNGLPLGPCMFPAEFTLPEDGTPTPERRHSFVATQDGNTGYVLLGKTDCGVINDVWALDVAAGTWELLRPPTGGEACNRTGTTGCSQLCF